MVVKETPLTSFIVMPIALVATLKFYLYRFTWAAQNVFIFLQRLRRLF